MTPNFIGVERSHRFALQDALLENELPGLLTTLAYRLRERDFAVREATRRALVWTRKSDATKPDADRLFDVKAHVCLALGTKHLLAVIVQVSSSLLSSTLTTCN